MSKIPEQWRCDGCGAVIDIPMETWRKLVPCLKPDNLILIGTEDYCTDCVIKMRQAVRMKVKADV